MKYKWNIKFYMKSGSMICGTYDTECDNSADVFKEILSPFEDTRLMRYTFTISTGKKARTNILMNEVEAIEISC